MSQTDATAPRTRRSGVRILAIVAAAAVPLAFAGLTMASLADTEEGVHRIPAAIVNADEMVTQTAEDGTETPILAGRLLVTELTGADSPGMDWRLSNEEEAAAALAAGDVYAVLTIPSDFSASVVSLSSAEPTRAELTIETDDAHSYVAGSVAQSLGDGMVRAFGTELTTQYISGIYAQFGLIGDAFTQAADGAGKLSDGADKLSDGASQAASGASQAASGAYRFADGVAAYTDGVSALSKGLAEMKKQTAGLGDLGAGVAGYTEGVSGLSAAIAEQVALLAADPNDAVALGTLQYLSSELATAAAGGAELGAGAAGLGGLESGIAKTASGAATLAANGATLASGARGLADGTSSLASGVSQLADGTTSLASGASELASGLQEGAAQLPTGDDAPSDAAAAVAAEPVGLEVTRANGISAFGQVIGTYLVPLGLWVGAVAIFLVLPPLSRRVLASTAGSGRVLGSTLVRALAVAGVQALLLVVLLHVVAGVDWALLPATFAFSLVAAAAFTAFHQLLTIGLGRGGLIISLLLLSVQIASVGGIVPAQALAGPFTWVGSLLPLSWATTGLQHIVAGGQTGVAVGAAFGLTAFGAASVLVSRLALGRTRRAEALGLLLPAAA